MLCVTGNEATLPRLAARLERHRELMQEVRLDALEVVDDDLFALLRRFGPKLIVCCRPKREGGAFVGEEAARVALLRRAVAAGVASIDIENDCNDEQLRRVRQAGGARLLLSWHDFQGCPDDLERRVERMAARAPDWVKVAVALDDAADCDRLRKLQRCVDRPIVAIGMGPAGMLSRCRYPAFGSPWTYVKADDESGTAPGQLSFAQAGALGLPQTASMPFIALVGGPQVEHAPEPGVYNALFRGTGQRLSCIAVSTGRPSDALELLRDLGALGASVAVPHREAALALAGSAVDAAARGAGLATALRFAGGAIEATHTDGEVAADAIGDRGEAADAWAVHAARQISWITKDSVTPAALRRYVPAREGAEAASSSQACGKGDPR